MMTPMMIMMANIIPIKKRCHYSQVISMDIDTSHNHNHDTISSFTLQQHNDDDGYDPNNDNADHDTDTDGYPFLLNRQMIAQAAD